MPVPKERHGGVAGTVRRGIPSRIGELLVACWVSCKPPPGCSLSFQAGKGSSR